VKNRIKCLILSISAGLVFSAVAAETSQGKAGTPVVFGDTLFRVTATVGSFTPGDRAQAIEQRLKSLSQDPFFAPESLTITSGESSIDIGYRDLVIVSVTQLDAAGYGKTPLETARDYSALIGRAVEAERKNRSFGTIVREILLSLVIIAGLVIVMIGILRLMRLLRGVLARYRLPGLQIKKYQVVSSDKIKAGVQLMAKIMTLGLMILAVFIALPLLFSVFPWSRGFAAVLWALILTPLRSVAAGFVNFIPNLFTIAVIFLVTRYAVKFLRVLADGIEKGGLRIARFHTEWARPTFDIARFVLYVFMFIIIFPYLPGSSSPAFQGVSVFLGVLLSFGSSSAVSNIIAGLVITYMRPFKVGDRVKIGEVTGDVIEKGMLVTRIRTIKNEDINIPNANILTGHTVNYSVNPEKGGLILYTTVTIGYDAPWRLVHKMLLDAATAADGVLKDPKPFVLQTSLDDFYVSYQLNCYTDQPNRMAVIYAGIHQNIQDEFTKNGVQIMSPHYLGDPAKAKVPPISSLQQ
jgi:small-conductance mechanosensitive channel